MTMGLELVVTSDQRIVFIGQTRMGKTFLVERLVKQFPRVIAIDSKHVLRWNKFHMTSDPLAALTTNRVIYRPDDGKPPNDFYMEAVRSLHRRGGGVIVIDEGAYVTTANSIQKGLSDAIRLGGELGVGIWVLCQEAVTVHNIPLRQSDMIIMFYNQGDTDRTKLAKLVGDMAYTTERLDSHDFIVFTRGETRDGQEVPVYRAVA